MHAAVGATVPSIGSNVGDWPMLMCGVISGFQVQANYCPI